jgi:hypothetical protein
MKDYQLIKKALAEGVDAVNIGPLGQWAQDDLQALIEECDGFYEEASGIIERSWQAAVVEPDNVLSPARSKALDEARDHADMEMLAKCSELCAAALVWMERK